MATQAPRTSFATRPPPAEGFPRRPAFILAAVAVLAVAAYFVFFHSTEPVPVKPAAHLPFGPEEQAYAGKIQFGNFAMSRAENFLNQEVTILSGDAVNTGDLALRGIEVTIEFQNDMQQIILRETRLLFAASAPPLEPGKSAHFDISFDHVPPSWNMQTPSVRVSGLRFAKAK